MIDVKPRREEAAIERIGPYNRLALKAEQRNPDACKGIEGRAPAHNWIEALSARTMRIVQAMFPKITLKLNLSDCDDVCVGGVERLKRYRGGCAELVRRKVTEC